MNLGELDVCLRVTNAGNSQCFYESLGFEAVEGNALDGWVVLANGSTRLGLYEPSFMSEDIVSLNFRGGDIRAIVEGMDEGGRDPSNGPKFGSRGSMVQYRDPDGHLIYFETQN